MNNQVDTPISLDEKKKKFTGWVKLATLTGVGLLIAPVIFIAIGGVVGLGIAAAVGFTMVQLAPWFALKVSNLRYRMIDAEKVEHLKKVAEAAAENPIETLTNLLIERRKAFKVFEQNVVTATAARDTFRDKIKKFAERYPARAAEFQAQLKRVVDMVDKKQRALKEAQKSLEDGDLKLEEMKAYWEMSKDAIELNKAAGMDTGDAWERLKADTAVDSVFESMNTAFAALEVAAALEVESDNTPAQSQAIGYNEPIVLDAPEVRTTQKVSR